MSGRNEFSKATKRKRADMAGGRCENPRCRTSVGPFHHDHDVPCWKGGDNSLENCRYICAGRPGSCHSIKSAKEEAEQAHHDRLAGRVNARSGEPVKAQCQGTNRHRGKLQSRGFQGSRPLSDPRWRRRMNGKVEAR